MLLGIFFGLLGTNGAIPHLMCKLKRLWQFGKVPSSRRGVKSAHMVEEMRVDREPSARTRTKTLETSELEISCSHCNER